MIGASIARRFDGAAVGSQLRFGGREWRVVGHFEARGSAYDSEVWADAGQLQQAFRRNAWSSVVARLTDPALFDVPVLYLTGHDTLKLSAAEITALRAYLSGGGMLVAEACCGRQAFDRAFRDVMSAVFPGSTPETPLRNHAVFAIPNAIRHLTATDALRQAGGQSMVEPELLFWKHEGHLAVVYSPRGLAGGWELAPIPYSLGYTDSLLLGENILMLVLTR